MKAIGRSIVVIGFSIAFTFCTVVALGGAAAEMNPGAGAPPGASQTYPTPDPHP
jgi:hypothetical protein